ncbi:hypothetical protein [Flavobacterium sp. AJR]|jgi:hypothetical protein|uniref:hypothetical protein n=1 Tax=Flavobacterium sp. AJR TaxID=1979369 RepID=UPI000A3D7436|nr:hypothetical protein [Flavobacterium sp. AJR]OUL63910.1 hypothetical protein B8T70_02865 [Flavobacterium sp. AJR]
MKFVLFVFLIFCFGCETKKDNTARETKTEIKRFIIGDVNNDKIQDTAFVRVISHNNLDQVAIEFSKIIPPLSFESLGVYIQKVNDLNGDNRNEIIIFSRTHEGWWNEISIWSFYNQKWEKIAKTKAFISEDKDFKNRIIKENGNYFLIGDDMWNEDEKGAFLKTKVKI